MRKLLLLGIVVNVWTVGSVPLAQAQGDRRERAEPILMIETGARMGTCDVLAFTPDGQHLLAAGDDRVVRAWRHGAKGLELPAGPTLRWCIFREQRGAIYALAISPDRAGKFVAVGGLGVRNGSACVIERETGKIVHAIAVVQKDEEVNKEVIWFLAFSPSGRQLALGKADGSIWLWDLDKKGPNDIRHLGSHLNPNGLSINRVRLITFLDEQTLISAARDGTVLEWNLKNPTAPPTLRFRFDVPNPFRVAYCPERRLLAAAGETLAGKNINRVEVRTLDGTLYRTIQLKQDADFAHSVAFDPKGNQLAVGVRVIGKGDFYREVGDRVEIHDLRANPPRLRDSRKLSHHADYIAFHPTQPRIAVAGGNDHEVSLWDIDHLAGEPRSVVRSPGSAIWSVRFARDGKALAFQTDRDPNPATPNQQGRGAWTVFDLQTRRFRLDGHVEKIEPLTEAGGWKVDTDTRSAYDWNVVAPNGTPYRLPLEQDFDYLPRCYTFLKAEPGKPVRLAVGHLWGFSLFELDTNGPRRVRVFQGHNGYVHSIAPSADQQILLTASRDQTIAAWSLAEWPSGSRLGAKFGERLGKVYVDAVDAGSPAWEAGLTPGDEIARLGIYPKWLDLKPGSGKGEWLTRLATPVPNVEHVFVVNRANDKEPTTCLTRVRERPLWHFFPTRDGEWVLWRHFDYYYDCSPRGDQWIGWQISRDVDRKPEFYPASQFSAKFYNPAKVAQTLQKTRVAPEKAHMIAIEPPELALTANTRNVSDAGVTLQLKATPRGPQEAHRPQRVILWIGDHKYKEWRLDSQQRGATPFAAEVTIPSGQLRHGDNRLSLQAFSSNGMISAVERTTVHKAGQPPQPRLFLLQAGVVDYTKAKPPAGFQRPGNLPSVAVDLFLVKEAWQKQEKRFFAEVKVLELNEEQVTPAALKKHFQTIAAQARPDDLMVLFLNGHGFTELDNAGTFVFITPRFDGARPSETGITAELLYDGLTAIPCRKLVLLSACHSGDAAKWTPREPVRDLFPGGIGPLVLTAAQHRESAWASNEGSLFAQAIVEALDDRFLVASRGRPQLDVADFVAYVKSRVAALHAAARQKKLVPADSSQTPVAFPEPALIDRFPIAGKGG